MKLRYSTYKKIYHLRKGLRIGFRFFLLVYTFMLLGTWLLG